MMANHYRTRDEDEYEQEDYDEYEEEGSEGEEEYEQVEEEPPSKEQEEFLRLREKLKEKYRQEIKKETASSFRDLTASQTKRKSSTTDNFGSFFGPSKPVVASRVIDESRSIRENPHMVSKVPKASSGSAKQSAHRPSDNRTVVQKKQPKVFNEVRKKVQTLKDTRDYSFLFSDGADFPDKEETLPAPRKASIPNPDRHSAQPSAKSSSKPLPSKHVRPVSNGHPPRNPPVSKYPQSQPKAGPVNGNAPNRPRPATAEPRKVVNGGNGSGRPVMNKPLPSKVSSQTTSTNRPLAKVPSHPQLKSRPPSSVPHSSAQKSQSSAQNRPSQSTDRMSRPSQSMDRMSRPSQSMDRMKSVLNRPLPSSRPQASKNIPPPKDRHDEHRHDERIKKKPMKRRLDESDDEDAIGMIRKMFGYNPNKYRHVDDDVSDMEADFNSIQKEERRSAKIAREEDEEQLRLIEEEERRERMRKKRKLK